MNGQKQRRSAERTPIKNVRRPRSEMREVAEGFSAWVGETVANLAVRPSDISKRARAKNAVIAGVRGLVFSLAGVGDEVFPFGIAFVIASSKDTAAVLVGSMAGSLLLGGYDLSLIYMGLAIVSYILRIGLSSGTFGESLKKRMGLSVVFGLFPAVIRVCLAPTAVNFAAGVCQAVLTPLGTYMFYRGNAKRASGTGTKAPPDAADIFPVAVAITALSRFSVFGSSPAFVAASAAVMFTARLYGPQYGGTAGLVFGSVCAGGAALPTVLGICGLCEGALARFKRMYTPIFHLAAAPLLLLAFSNGDATKHRILDSIIAVMLTAVAMHLFGRRADADPGVKNPPRSIGPARDLGGLSEAFSSLSRVFFRMSERLKDPSEEAVRAAVTRVCDSFCGKCHAKNECPHVGEIASSELVYKALSEGRLAKDTLPRYFASECRAFERLLYAVNTAYKELYYEYFKDNRTEILASHYSSVARLIKYTSEEVTERYRTSDILADKAKKALIELRIFPERIEAYDGRDAEIIARGIRLGSVTTGASRIASHLSARTGIVFGTPEFTVDGTNAGICFKRRRKISVEYAKACRAKNGERVNGDSVSFFETGKDYFYALVSDGMGSGREAALTSRLTAVFIEKLLETGAHKGATLELLNSLLLTKSGECFATVDLMEIDLLEGKASFLKAGAAPAFVVRNSKLYKVSSETPPAGIIDAFTAENTTFTLKRGDVILLLSDGVTDGMDGTLWLAELLGYHIGDGIGEIAEAVLERAKLEDGHDDDMSVVAVRIR